MIGGISWDSKLRLRLHGTRQICIWTNNRADTVCMRSHGTTLSGQVFDHLSVQVYNLPRKRTSAGQIFVLYRVNANRNKYLYGFVPVFCLKLR